MSKKSLPESAKLNCHKMIAKTAQEFARELYEIVMGDNLVREAWKKDHPGMNEKQLIRRFVEVNAANCIAPARATLAAMLNGPYPEKMKEEIYEALLADNSLNRQAQGESMASIISKVVH